jgi:hypothetical protein
MKTFLKVTLLFIFINSLWSLYGDSKQITFTPIPICGFYTQHKGGDKDFHSNGPVVYAKVSIQIINQKEIKTTLHLWAKETKGDYTFFKSYGERIIWTVPVGYIITGINSPGETLSEQKYTDSNLSMDYFNPIKGPVSRFEIMGDQIGNDHPYMNVYFKAITVQVKEVGTGALKGIDIKNGDVICLSSDNNKYLSRIGRGLTEPIEAEKSQIDPYCKFKVVVLNDSTIALLADNNIYLSRITRTTEAIEAAKAQIDSCCQFKVTVLNGSTITLLADNNKYLSRIPRSSTNPIEAAKSQISTDCKFIVTKIPFPFIYSVNSLENKFSGLPGIKNALGFKIPSCGIDLKDTKHFQGMARGVSWDGTPYLFLTKSGEVAGELWIVKMGSRYKEWDIWGSNLGKGTPPESDRLIYRVFLNGKSKDMNGNTWPQCNHPGGVQLVRNVLVISLHGSGKVGIILIDFKDPEHPIYLKTIDKFGDKKLTNSNAVGVTQIPSGKHIGKYLFVVGGSRIPLLTFGVSSGNDIRDPNLTINFCCDYSIPKGDKMIGEAFNLVRDKSGLLYLISFCKAWRIPNWGMNWAYLFKLNLNNIENISVAFIKEVGLSKDTNIYGDADAAACSYMSPSRNLILYMSTHYDYNGYVKIGEFASK